MSIIESKLNPRSEEFKINHAAMLSLVNDLRDKIHTISLGGGHAALEKMRAKGKLPARERIDLLVDAGSPFLECSALAAHNVYAEVVPAAGIITGR